MSDTPLLMAGLGNPGVEYARGYDKIEVGGEPDKKDKNGQQRETDVDRSAHVVPSQAVCDGRT